MIAGPRFSEGKVLALARAFEQATEFHKRKPPITPDTPVPPLAATEDDAGEWRIEGLSSLPPSGGQGNEPSAYACPMHPEVVSDRPDRCPHCGMRLVPAGLVGEAGGTSAATLQHHHGGGHGPVPEWAEGIEWEDNMVNVNRLTTPANTRWSLVNRTSGAQNAAIDWRFRVGDRVKIRLVNEMDSDHPMHHPFHIHGAGRFLVLAGTACPRTTSSGRTPCSCAPARRWTSCWRSPTRALDGALPHRGAPRERHDVQLPRRSGSGVTPGSDDVGPAAGVYDVIVVGAGQAGLAMGWFLARQGLRFQILEAAGSVGAAWRDRWDSLVLFTPARYSGLPGLPLPGSPDAYPTRDEVIAYLLRYAEHFELPVAVNSRVNRLASREGGGYTLSVGGTTYEADQVVVATGPFQVPFVPSVAEGLAPDVVQLHSSGYRTPAGLPEGPVLVVGGGNTGFQITDELADTRTVHLSIGSRQTPLPQRFLGKDLFWWLARLRLMEKSTRTRMGRRMKRRDPALIGSSPRRLTRRRPSVTIHPRVVSAAGRTVTFADGATSTSPPSSGPPATASTSAGSTSPARPRARSRTGAA